MADLLTVYDDGESNTLIDCTVCDKRIRGETHFKIHQTTLQHLKRERALADKGLIPEPEPLPEWTSIKQYLTYLNLNEPIIGLSHLVQELDSVSNDGKPLLQYRCRLCAVQMDLYDTGTHVVGRRHRQKYLERHRPDLVTWDKSSEKHAGVVARAKAAMVEKQDGWGNPVPLIRADKGRSVRNRAPDRLPHLQKGVSSGPDRRKPGFYNRSYMEGDSYGRPSRYHEDNQYNQSYRDDFPHRPSGSGNNRCNAPYSQDGRQRRSFQERDHMERRYINKSSSLIKPYNNEWYPETNPSRRPYKGREDDDYCYGNISQSRFGESGMDYQQSRRMQDSMYTSHHGAGPGLVQRQWQSRNMPYVDKGRGHFQDIDETGREGSFEMEDFNKRQMFYQTGDGIPAERSEEIPDSLIPHP